MMPAFGKKADITIMLSHVCFRGQSGHEPKVLECPLMTQSGHRTGRNLWRKAPRVIVVVSLLIDWPYAR